MQRLLHAELHESVKRWFRLSWRPGSASSLALESQGQTLENSNAITNEHFNAAELSVKRKPTELVRQNEVAARAFTLTHTVAGCQGHR